jgi:GalNAc5-diNAcBac-PP-undecaprenol beta-1,3-glucosyltransferase
MIPTVSIIMATYNRAHLIAEMLDSVKQQKYTQWECIIVNDGSTDDTDLVVQKYSEHDKRFRYVYRPQNYGKGLPGCRNYGLDIANGEYVVFFDDDDVVHPQLLELSVKGISSGMYDFCQYRKQWFAEHRPDSKLQTHVEMERTLNHTYISDLITYKYPMASCTVLWKKSFLSERFDDTLQYAEEWEYYNRLFLHHPAFKGLVLKNTLYYNRKHPQSNTGEFFNADTKRIQSHSKASYLLLCNYIKSEYTLNKSVTQYLLNILIRNRAKEMYTESVKLLTSEYMYRLYRQLAYLCYPFYYPVYKVLHKLK